MAIHLHRLLHIDIAAIDAAEIWAKFSFAWLQPASTGTPQFRDFPALMVNADGKAILIL